MVTFSVGEKILNGTSYVLTEALVLIKPLSGVRTFLQGMGSDASWEMVGREERLLLGRKQRDSG